MMRAATAACLAVAAMLCAAPAAAAEKGLALRNGDLHAQPFVDADKAGTVKAKQSVTIVGRKGGWAQVEAGGQTGWIRLLNLRLEPSAENAAGGKGKGRGQGAGVASLSNPASLLRTGSSSRTVTTGVKGMDEESIRAAVPDTAELAELGTLAVGAEEARENAVKSELRETQVPYLPKGRG